MNIEEKARAYDEALDRCKEWASGTCGHSVADSPKDVAEFIFPQLAESEDERVRKELLEVIRHCYEDGGYALCTDDYKKYSAYLEKQKEQKPKQVPKWLYRLEFKDNSCGLWYNGQGEWCFENGIGSLDDSCKTKNLPMDYDERYKQDGRNWFSSCSKKEDLLHWYSKEDAKTLLNKGFVFTRYLATEYHEYDQQTVFIKETALYREEINFLELMKEQKPAEWSDEDKAMIKSILFVLESYVSQSESASSPSLITTYPTYYKEIDWLKSLRPQSKQEWSEEDERILKGIIGLIDHDQHYGVSNNEMISWLKTLRPQPQTKTNDYITPHKKFFQWIYNRLVDVHGENPNVDYMRSFKERIDNLQFDEPHWKPGEEQMKALHAASSVSSLGEYVQRHLFSLYKDLKKLM